MQLDTSANRKLYLARFTLVTKRYPDGPRRKQENQMRLVWAGDEDEARDKLERAEAPETSPGDDMTWLENIELSEAI